MKGRLAKNLTPNRPTAPRYENPGFCFRKYNSVSVGNGRKRIV